jgi:dipeptidyl aminopeptidase/acylaminoacyl peptidase
MKSLKKILELTILLVLSPILIAKGIQKEVGSQALQAGLKKPFTVDDSLALEFLNSWSSPRFACHENLIAYAVVDKYYERGKEEEAGRFFVPPGSHIFIYHLPGGQPLQLTEGTDYSWSPSWSPDGTKLAFYRLHNNRVSLGVWDKITKKKEYFDLNYLQGRDSIEWDPQGQKIFFSSNAVELKGSLEPYEASEDPIIRMSSQEVNPYDKKLISRSMSQLMSFDLNTKRIGSITPRSTNILALKISQDGKKAAVLEIIKHKIRIHLIPTINNLVIYPIGGGEPKTVVTNSEITQFSWAPDSEFLAYVDDGKLFIYSLGENKTTLLGKNSMRITGDPLWLPGSKGLFCVAGSENYLFDVPAGKAKFVKINVPYEKDFFCLDEQGKFLYFKVLDQETGRQGIYRVSLRNEKSEELIMGDWMLKDAFLTDSHLFFTLQNATTPENLWMLNLQTKTKSQITEMNKPAVNFAFGQSELISWKSSAGDPLKGVLLYPANYEKGKKYPVIFCVYETFSSEVHHFYVHLYNLQVLTNQKYAVFLPDINFTIGDTSLSYIRSVEPAQDRLLELGIANGKFGVMGHSFGGYATNAIVTHSKKFQAAVAISGISDWVSFHGLPGDFMRLSNESGQGRMGGDLRDYPERFVKNSPVFYLHQVETPLMIIHGTQDYGVPFSQAEEMYYGLRHLKKTAVLIGYPGEDHLYWETKIRVIKDMWERILAWFDKYLK